MLCLYLAPNGYVSSRKKEFHLPPLTTCPARRENRIPMKNQRFFPSSLHYSLFKSEIKFKIIKPRDFRVNTFFCQNI